MAASAADGSVDVGEDNAPMEIERVPDAEECSICLRPFTRVIRARVACQDCNSTACRSCVQQYLTTSDQPRPHCFGCRRELSFVFLASNLTQTFVRKTLQQRIVEAELDAERARLPDSQGAAQIIITRNALNSERYILGCARRNLSNAMSVARRRFAAAESGERVAILAEYDRLKNKVRTNRELRAENKVALDFFRARSTDAMHEPENELRAVKAAGRDTYRVFRVADGGDGEAVPVAPKPEPKREFRFRCQKDGCRGFVNHVYHCGLCGTWTCSKCFAVRDEDHECREEDVETAKEIRKSTKPCPKCGTRISRISGCSQMWCTACNTAFSWRTGLEIPGTIHNPHYFEWRRNGGAPAAAGVDGGADAPDWCGGNDTQRITAINRRLGPLMARHDIIARIYRAIAEVNDELDMASRMGYGRLGVRNEDAARSHMRISFLVGTISEDDWRTELSALIRHNRRANEERDILRTFCNVVCDVLERSIDNVALSADVPEEVSAAAIALVQGECGSIETYCNRALARFAKIHGSSKAYQVGDAWDRRALRLVPTRVAVQQTAES
jgi:hypothetical protein